ncbi:MAG: 2OG-Fe(II) oxygenase [Gammaproteobacteria bacterium]
MNERHQVFPTAAFAAALEKTDVAALRRQFVEQNEVIAVEDFLPAECLQQLLAALPALEPRVHRNFIPKHKKGGSVSRFTLDDTAPAFPELYRMPALLQFLAQLTGEKLMHCPADDAHTYALYYYTEAGDHIGWHYDTSYYRGSRYTILFGLVDESSCKLEYELYKDDPNRESRLISVSLKPGMLVVFNGDRLWHRVTPLAAGERRVVLTLEYVTSTAMHPFRRFVSNMKDAIAYFGFKQVFKARAH